MNEDSIVIYQPTDFRYNVSTYGLKFNAAVVKYLDWDATYTNGNQLFTIYSIFLTDRHDPNR